jgi:hypothetical protein
MALQGRPHQALRLTSGSSSSCLQTAYGGITTATFAGGRLPPGHGSRVRLCVYAPPSSRFS